LCRVCDSGDVDLHREVIQAAEARARALTTGDADGLRRLLHEDFRWTSHSGEAFTRADYIRRNTMGPVTWKSQHLNDVEVTIVDDAAVLRAEATDVVESEDGTETYRMPMTQVWVRRDGGWRCLAGHAGPRRT
jgi:ketosteroid isomerase-like protein